MYKRFMHTFLIASLTLGMTACSDDDKKEDGGGAPSCVNSCKDAETLNECQSNGSTEEKHCDYGCNSDQKACNDAPSCVNSCKDAETLNECQSNGSTVEKHCDNGCNSDQKACNEAPSCENSCKDADTLNECQNNGSTEEKHCDYGCNSDQKACNDAPSCVNSCKDAKTLLECQDDGTTKEMDCQGRCFENECRDIDYCNENTDCTMDNRSVCEKDIHRCIDSSCVNKICGKSQTCRQGLCISDAAINAQWDDVCEPESFTDYCRPDNTWVYCSLASNSGGVEEYKVRTKSCGKSKCISYKYDDKDSSVCDLGLDAETVCGTNDSGQVCEDEGDVAFMTTYACVKSTDGERVVIMIASSECGDTCYGNSCF